jgi:hypothetical protein
VTSPDQAVEPAPSPRAAPWRLAAILLLWALVGLIAFLMTVQTLLVVLAPRGHWQWPRIATVTVETVVKDEEGRITGEVLAREDDRLREFRFAREEAADLGRDDEIRILENYFAGGARPSAFRFSAWRLLLEYPQPLLLLALVLLRRLHRAKARAEAYVPDIPRKVWKDEFHARAERFGEEPKEPS